MRRRIADPHAVEDVISETYAVALRRRHNVPSKSSEALKWLLVTARFVLSNNQRSMRRRARLMCKLQDAASAATHTSPSADQHVELIHAWHTLAGTDQELFRLWLASRNVTELAERLGISEGAAKLRLLRARRRLRGAL